MRTAKELAYIDTLNNLNNDEHREIIGGPKLGRNVTLKLNARF